MVSSVQLAEVFSEMADEELVKRIKGDDLTDIAREVAQKELDLRKINLNNFQVEQVKPSVFSEVKLKIKPLVVRILKFPLKVFSGSEPLWVVAIFGLVSAYIVNQLLIQFLNQYIFTKPITSLTFPILYIIMGCRVVVYAFISIAIWRSAYNAKLKIAPIIAFACSVFFLLFALWSTYMTLDLVGEYNPGNSSDIMENSVIQMR